MTYPSDKLETTLDLQKKIQILEGDILRMSQTLKRTVGPQRNHLVVRYNRAVKERNEMANLYNKMTGKTAAADNSSWESSVEAMLPEIISLFSPILGMMVPSTRGMGSKKIWALRSKETTRSVEIKLDGATLKGTITFSFGNSVGSRSQEVDFVGQMDETVGLSLLRAAKLLSSNLLRQIVREAR